MSEFSAEHFATDEHQTEALGAAVGRACREGDVIALDGPLGAGKTRFVRGLALGLGFDPSDVTSPTFTLVQEYERREASPIADHAGIDVLVHIDAYRLTGSEELDTIGWVGDGAELRRGAVVAVEWAARIADHLPPHTLHVALEHQPEGRRLTFHGPADWSKRLDLRLSN